MFQTIAFHACILITAFTCRFGIFSQCTHIYIPIHTHSKKAKVRPEAQETGFAAFCLQFLSLRTAHIRLKKCVYIYMQTYRERKTRLPLNCYKFWDAKWDNWKALGAQYQCMKLHPDIYILATLPNPHWTSTYFVFFFQHQKIRVLYIRGVVAAFENYAPKPILYVCCLFSRA